MIELLVELCTSRLSDFMNNARGYWATEAAILYFKRRIVERKSIYKEILESDC